MGMLHSSMIRIFALLLLLSSRPAAANINIEAAFAPDTTLDLTVAAIKNAKQSILLNIYELSSPYIAEALLTKIQAGVSVQILEEGQPVGGFSAASRGIESQLVQAMKSSSGANHFFVMSSNGTRRFRFDHGKYIIIDGNQLLIGSENYSPSGNPSPGTIGNRGWEVLIHDSGIAQNFAGVFRGDASTSFGDVQDMVSGKAITYSPPSSSSSFALSGGNIFSASAVQRITSPDSSLSGILSLINHAKRSIDIELMTFDSTPWSAAGNPLVSALQSAAHRGVSVHVLLNDESAFAHTGPDGQPIAISNPKNQPTVDLLNRTGGSLIAKIANIKGMGVDYIHNKGMIVDGSITLISSINWDQNSIQNNREAAVAITSSGLAGFYGNLFERDWQVSGGQ